MKKLAACVRLAFCCSTALLAAEARAQLEGTLFTKPEEREYLDYLRTEFLRNSAQADFNIQEADIPEIPDAAVAEAVDTGPVQYSFGGVMTRRDGIRIWLNGQLLAEAELPEGFSVDETGRSVSLRIMHNGKTYVLLPGQTVDVNAGTVIENFQQPAVIEAAPLPAPLATTQASVETTTAGAPASVAGEPAAEASADEVAADATTTNTPEPSFRSDNIDGAVATLSDTEADELAAALERRRAAEANAPAVAEEAGDAP